MTETAPRPCLHTTIAILGVLLAGMLLGGFSREPAAQTPLSLSQIPVKAATTQ